MDKWKIKFDVIWCFVGSGRKEKSAERVLMEYIRGDPGKNKSEGITIRKAEGERERKIERQETEAVEEDKAEREAILQLFRFFYGGASRRAARSGGGRRRRAPA